MSFSLATILFLAFGVQATAGFGAALLALALGTLLWPVSELLPVVIPLALALSLYISVRYWRHADLRLLAFTMIPLIGIGLVCGLIVKPCASPQILRLLLGIVVSGAATRGLYTLVAGRAVAAKKGGTAAAVWLLLAGVAHGLIATGGPLVVYAVESAGLGKERFRSTLALMWVVVNSIIVGQLAITGDLGGEQLETVGLLLPVLVSSTLVGEFLHSRVSEGAFRAVVFLLLAVAGVLLCAPMVLGVFL